MKKIIVIIIAIMCTIVVAKTDKFTFNIEGLATNLNDKAYQVEKALEEYEISYQTTAIDSKLEKQINELSKKTTSLLLGGFNNQNETSENYYKRYEAFLDLRYAPTIPKDDRTFSGFDEASQEYKDDTISGIALPTVFNDINEREVIYDSYGEIKIIETDNFVGSMVTLPKVKLKKASSTNPAEYEYVETSLILHYYYKLQNKEYKLYYLYIEEANDLTNYFKEIEKEELTFSKAIVSNYNNELSTIYDYSKLKNISSSTLSKIYDSNLANLVYIRAYNNNGIEEEANGFLITDSLVITTWSFLNKALEESQYLTVSNTVKDFEIEGIVTINSNYNFAIIKLKENVPSSLKIADSIKLQVEDPLINLSSKSGVNFSIQTGIVVANTLNLVTSLSLSNVANGSPLFNLDGEVLGMMTLSGSLSEALSSQVLKEIQTKLQAYKLADLKTITFDELKEQFYQNNNNQEKIENNLKGKIWQEYSQIGDIENTIKLDLIKANYQAGIVSLRYKNKIPNYLSSLTLAMPFINQLKSDNYQEKMISSKKAIYENKDYRVIIMEEFSYLIILMEKL